MFIFIHIIHSGKLTIHIGIFIVHAIKEKLKDLINDFDMPGKAINLEENKAIIEGLHMFLTKLIAHDMNYEVPLWEGLNEIKEPRVFLAYFSVLLEYMWI